MTKISFYHRRNVVFLMAPRKFGIMGGVGVQSSGSTVTPGGVYCSEGGIGGGGTHVPSEDFNY